MGHRQGTILDDQPEPTGIFTGVLIKMVDKVDLKFELENQCLMPKELKQKESQAILCLAMGSWKGGGVLY